MDRLDEETRCPICGSEGACPQWCREQQGDPGLAYHNYDCVSSGRDCERGCNCYGCRHYEHYDPRDEISPAEYW